MRGKVISSVVMALFCRITPAYAGKSRNRPAAQKRVWDHPRLCGEKEPQKYPAFRPRGSPPPMRGKVVIARYGTSSNRITPAYAGKSVHGVSRCHAVWDHPRLCGEKEKFPHT